MVSYAPNESLLLSRLDRPSPWSQRTIPDDYLPRVHDGAVGVTSFTTKEFHPHIRTSFPGHPGYVAGGDDPVGVPGSYAGQEDQGRRMAQSADTGVSHAELISKEAADPVYGYDEPSNWGSVLGERAAVSPRFFQAVRDINSESPGSFTDRYHTMLSPTGQGPLSDEEKTYTQRWDRANQQQSLTYWKAHRDVQMGRYDHIEDPYEDRAAAQSRPERADPQEARRWRPIKRSDGRGFIQ